MARPSCQAHVSDVAIQNGSAKNCLLIPPALASKIASAEKKCNVGLERPSPSSLSSLEAIRAEAKSTLLALHRELLTLSTLSPCHITDAFFCKLVKFVIRPIYGEVAPSRLALSLEDDDEVTKIRPEFVKACSQGEGELELYWAKRITEGEDKPEQFPYHQNYIDLIRLEYHLLLGQGADPRHVLILGSGPLPLSGLMWITNHLQPRWSSTSSNDWSVTNVDCSLAASTSAMKASRTVLGKELDEHFHFVTAEANKLDATLVYAHDVIYLAALVGHDMKTKFSILRSVIGKMKPGARLMIRSADGMRQLLYPAVDEAALLCAAEGKLVLEATCHPRNHVVNSVIVARRV